MASGIRFSDPDPQFNSDNGVRLASGSILFYLTGTTTPATTYSQADLDPGSANADPVTLNSAGRASVEIFLDPAVTYRAILKDSDGNVIWDRDPVAGSDVTDAIEAHDVDPDSHFDATESSRGYVKELANDTEAQAMADTERVLTPANLAALIPLTTRAGLVERATTAEIEAGTDDLRYISPLGAQDLQATSAEILTGTDTKHFMGIANWVANTSVAGSPSEMSMKFPGGYTVKVGKRTSTQDAPETFTFAAAFATAVYGVFLQLIDANDSKALGLDSAALPTTAGFTIDRDSGFAGSKDFYFLAWGK